MTTFPTWTEQFLINPVEGDFYGKWKMSNLLLALQGAAAQHAIRLGAGYEALQAQNLAWMMSRFKVRLEGLPSAGERITIHTWPKGVQQRLFFRREFLVMDEAETMTYARATSAWLLTNTQTRRMERPAALNLDIPRNDGRVALDETLERITAAGEMVEQYQVQARPSMLDLMGHVTSARYLEWVVDCFPVAAYQEDGLEFLQVNFNREVRPGERVSISCGRQAPDSSTWVVQGNNLDSGSNAFDAAVGFRK